MLVDTTGETQSGLYEEIVLNNLGQYLADEMYIAKENGAYGIYNKKMKLECALDCEDVDVCTQDGVFAVKQNGKWGYVNVKGEMVIEPQFEQARSFSNGLGAVCKNGAWGFVDLTGRVVIDYQFVDVGYMDASGICPVRVDPEEKTDVAQEEETQESWKLLQLENGILEE